LEEEDRRVFAVVSSKRGLPVNRVASFVNASAGLGYFSQTSGFAALAPPARGPARILPSGGRSEAGRAARGAPVAGAGGHLHRARRHGPLRRAVRRAAAGPRRVGEAAGSEREKMIGFFRA